MPGLMQRLAEQERAVTDLKARASTPPAPVAAPAVPDFAPRFDELAGEIAALKQAGATAAGLSDRMG
ncbi:hypothetical protein J8J27_33210, partial [Mycobacterium tuberculosis]|nr:hypothetical protein [Mycobacterium tuberculosis]